MAPAAKIELYRQMARIRRFEERCAELYGGLGPFKAMATLAALLPGMPLVYGGQEAFFEKRLQFFEKDPIDCQDRSLEDFYQSVLHLHRSHPALAHGAAGGEFAFQDVGNPRVVAFSRRKGRRQVDVATLLPRIDELASAVGQSLRTNIPRAMVPQLLGLAEKVDTKAVKNDRLANLVDDVRVAFRNARLTYTALGADAVPPGDGPDLCRGLAAGLRRRPELLLRRVRPARPSCTS